MSSRAPRALCLALVLIIFFLPHAFAFVGIQPPAALDITSSFVPAGVDASGTNSITFTPDGKYHLNYFQNGNLVDEYIIDTTDYNVSRGMLQVKENISQAIVLTDAGVRYHSLGYKSPAELANLAFNRVFQHQIFGNVLVLYYRETTNNPTPSFQATNERQYEFRIQGPSMLITIRDLAPNHQTWGNFAGITLGNSTNMSNPRPFANLPHMGWVPVILFGSPGNERFFSAYWDITKSNANDYTQNADIYGNPLLYPTPPTCSHTNPDPNCPPPFTGVFGYYYNYYRQNLASVVQPLYEQVYVTVSPKIQDTFMSIHYPASPRVADLRKRVVLDIFHMPYQNGLNGGTFFDRAADYVQKMYAWGARDLFVINHIWQQFGYDCGLPDTAPANSGNSYGTLPFGGTPAMQNLSSTARGYNFLFALHENWDAMMENTPLFNTSDIALDYYGNLADYPPIPSCASGPQPYLMSLNSANIIASNETAQIESLYSPNASYNDVLPGNGLRDGINYSATDSSGVSFSAVYQNRKQLFNTIKSTYNGPLAGEGLQNSDDGAQYFDNVEGVLASIQRGQYALVIPEFSLKQLHPVRANQGMGTPETYFSDAYGNYNDILNPLSWLSDDWHSSSILYGNVGIISEIGFTPAIRAAGNPDIGGFFHNAVTEYYLMRAIQEEYGSATATDISYLTASNNFVDLTTAILQGYASVDVNYPKMRVIYDNGLQVYVNQSPSQWNFSANGSTYYLPQYGWLAFNPNTNFFEYSGLMDASGNPSTSGTRKDIVRAPNALDPYTYADGRGTPTTFGLGYDNLPFTTSRVRVQKPTGFQLQEGATLGSFTPSTFSTSVPALSSVSSVPTPITQGNAATLTFTGSNLLPVTHVMIGSATFSISPTSNTSFSLSLSAAQTNALGVGSNAITLKVGASSYPQTQTILVVSAPPAIQNTLPPSNSSFAQGSAVPFSATISTPSNQTISVAIHLTPPGQSEQVIYQNAAFNAVPAGNAFSYNYPLSTTAAIGNYSWRLEATNAGGSTFSNFQSFSVVAGTPPDPSISALVVNGSGTTAVNTQTATITLQGANFLSTNTIYIDNNPFAVTNLVVSSSSVITFQLLSNQLLSLGNGSHSVRVHPLVGNNSNPVSFTISDPAPSAPTVSLSGPPNGTAVVAGNTITLQANIQNYVSELVTVRVFAKRNAAPNTTPNSSDQLLSTQFQATSTGALFSYGYLVPLTALAGNYQWQVTAVNSSSLTGTSGINQFTVQLPPGPVISSLSPTSVSIASSTPTNFTLQGSNFLSSSQVMIDGASITGITINSSATPNIITFSRSPAQIVALGLGNHNVLVSHAGGVSPSPGVFNIFSSLLPPSLSGLSPNAIYNNASAVIQINGSGFSSTDTITIGSFAVPGAAIVNNSSGLKTVTLTLAQVVALGVGGKSVIVSNAAGPSNALTLTVTPASSTPPSVAALSPSDNAAFDIGSIIPFSASVQNQISTEPLQFQLFIQASGGVPLLLTQGTITANPAGIVIPFNYTIPLDAPAGDYTWYAVVTNSIFSSFTASTVPRTLSINAESFQAPICPTPVPTCPLQLGVCSGSTQSCTNGAYVSCTTASYGSNYQSQENPTTSCSDGLDNDCDGAGDCSDSDCVTAVSCSLCGNATCNAGETCSTCSADCGSCPSNPPQSNNQPPGNTSNGGGGGGGGGGSSRPPAAVPPGPSIVTGNPPDGQTGGATSGDNPDNVLPSNGSDSIFQPQKLAGAIGEAITGNAADVGVGAIVLAIAAVVGIIILIQFFWAPH